MGIRPPQRCGFGLLPTLLVAEDVGWDKVVLDGDSQILISQICNLNDLADWIIEEDVQHLQRIVSPTFLGALAVYPGMLTLWPNW